MNTTHYIVLIATGYARREAQSLQHAELLMDYYGWKKSDHEIETASSYLARVAA